MAWRLDNGDCLLSLTTAEPNSVDSIVSDPPAGIGFMGREWDSDKGGREPWIDWMTRVMTEALRVLKPGGHALIWAIPRTSHWTATALENAGFEVRDVITHHFGSGFPKSQDVGKFIDKLAGAEREVVGQGTTGKSWGTGSENAFQGGFGYQQSFAVTAPASPEAQKWDGWGTALKPATEHWILARKPLSESSIARNVLKHGTGALNIDASRVERAADDVPGWHETGSYGREGGFLGTDTFKIRDMPPEEVQARCGGKGRWPPNLLLSHTETCEEGQCSLWCPVAELDRQSGKSRSSATARGRPDLRGGQYAAGSHQRLRDQTEYHSDFGGASRFFPTFRYQAKPSRSEREGGLDEQPERTLNRVNPGGIEKDPRWAPVTVKNNHPTLKAKRLMDWLIRLITPPGGLVLDPFAGSGSTGVAALEGGFSFWGIEQDDGYYEIAAARLQCAANALEFKQLTFEDLDDTEG